MGLAVTTNVGNAVTKQYPPLGFLVRKDGYVDVFGAFKDTQCFELVKLLLEFHMNHVLGGRIGNWVSPGSQDVTRTGRCA